MFWIYQWSSNKSTTYWSAARALFWTRRLVAASFSQARCPEWETHRIASAQLHIRRTQALRPFIRNQAFVLSCFADFVLLTVFKKTISWQVHCTSHVSCLALARSGASLAVKTDAIKPAKLLPDLNQQQTDNKFREKGKRLQRQLRQWKNMFFCMYHV